VALDAGTLPSKLAATLAALAFVHPLAAHHSISMIDISTPVWIAGTVVSYEIVNPHVMLTLEERAADGQRHRWTVEGPGLGRLARYGLGSDFLESGDAIEICGFVPKPNAERSFPPQRFVHGHVLVTPAGKMQWWGPYGKPDNCVRSTDRKEAWVELLSTDASLKKHWCSAYTASFPLSALASQSLVDEINASLADGCD
jgi:hypothetical protein